MNVVGRTLVAGVGSDFGDDRLGAVVVERLAALTLPCDLRVVRAPIDLLDHLQEVERLHIVDACREAGPPGTIVRRDWPARDFSTTRFSGTHDFGLVAVLQLADQLRSSPPRMTIWSIEASDGEDPATIGRPLSPAVAVAAEVLIERLAAEIVRDVRCDKEPIHA
jgi:hydrogenase maturation protease